MDYFPEIITNDVGSAKVTAKKIKEMDNQHSLSLPIDLKVIKKYDDKPNKKGLKVHRFLSMDENTDYVTVSIFHDVFRYKNVDIGNWYRFRGVTINNFKEWAGFIVRRDTIVKTFDELGLTIPSVTEPVQENPYVEGKLIHMENLKDYKICANSNTR